LYKSFSSHLLDIYMHIFEKEIKFETFYKCKCAREKERERERERGRGRKKPKEKKNETFLD